MGKHTFLDTPQSVKTFFDRTEKDFYLIQIGYHDFHIIRPHLFFKKQDFYTLHFIISGKGKLEIGVKVYELGAGDMFVVPPDTFYMYYPEKTEPWEYIFLVFNGTFAADYLKGAGFSVQSPVRSCSNYRKTLASFSLFFEKERNGLPISYFECMSLLYSTLHATLDVESELFASAKTDVIDEAKSLIQMQFFDADLTVESIADNLHFSHSQLCRLFKERTGTTMIAYINDTRMKYAEELFRTTSLKATEIAYMSGFKEYTYFLMQFKRRNHCTTSQYRTMLKKK